MESRLRKALTGGVLALSAAVPVVLALEASRQTVCDRGCLIDLANGSVEALLAHNPSALQLSPGVKTIENGRPVQLGDGVWKTARAISSRRVFADPASSEAAMFGIVTEQDGRTGYFAVHLKINRQRLQEIETVVAR